MPRISVVIPCYNHGLYIREAIDSVFTQTYSDWELIIVNDGSTDLNTLNILNSINLPRTKLINTLNQGLSAARNNGIREASGEIILPLDSDDKLGSRYMEKAIKAMDQNPKIGITYSRIRYFGERNGIMPMPPYSLRTIFFKNSFVPSCFFYKKDWEKVNGFDTEMKLGFEDWDFWISLIELGIAVYQIPETLFYYRVRKDSMYRSLSKDQKFSLQLQILKKHKEFFWVNIDHILHEIHWLERGILRRIKEDKLEPLLKILNPFRRFNK